MIISYETFIERLDNKFKKGMEFYLELLETVIDNPTRYCGLFRLSNAKTKLIQNVTQSREIKFGDFMEEIATDYIGLLGYKTLVKDIGRDENGDLLNADQVFEDDKTFYLVEQKVRDDHDSTKKRGQYENFDKKVRLLRKQHPSKHLVAAMWFIDDGLVKNRRYYLEQMENTHVSDTELHLYYGGDFFRSLKGGNEVWDEIIEYLTRHRIEGSNDVLSIPDFGKSGEIYEALRQLSNYYWNKLNTPNATYELLRKELFSNGDNLVRAANNRGKYT